MPDSHYHKLAKQLDAIPNGFPSTESGIEIRLLEKLFTPEEASLASTMRLTPEPVEEIAQRQNLEVNDANKLLKAMVRKGLIRMKRGDRKLLFGLMPFVVGFYEEQLPHIDEEFARLFEEYYQETRGGIISQGPSVHKIIPVNKAIPFELEIFSYEQANEILDKAKSWAVRKCICRVQQKLLGNKCRHPVENCLVFAPMENAFKKNEIHRPITKEEALDILKDAWQSGLVHSTGNYREGHSYICNCCICCCGILRGVSEFDVPTAVASADFVAVMNEDYCTQCGMCELRCPFQAVRMDSDKWFIESARCLGCGQCVAACPSDALKLIRRTDGKTGKPPRNIKEWMIRRAKERGISIRGVL